MTRIESLREKQDIAFGVLLYFKEFCDNNDIPFMLAYGTLLGAVRHKGFIPWDDDVDIMMTREAYNKFLNVWKNNKHPYYKFLSIETDPDYFAPLAKLYDDRTLLIQEYGQIEKKKYGIYIDVFVIDKLPDNFYEASEFYERNQKIRNCWGMAIRKFSAPSKSVFTFIGRIPLMIYCKIKGYKFYIHKYCTLAQTYNGEKVNHAGIVVFGEGIVKEYTELSQFTSCTDVTFESCIFKGPCDCHQYLRQMYGDYMTIPKEEDRKVHPSKCYWK